MNYSFSNNQKGWECPRCGTINAPFMPVCGGVNCKSNPVTIISDNATVDPIYRENLKTSMDTHIGCACPVCVPEKYKVNK